MAERILMRRVSDILAPVDTAAQEQIGRLPFGKEISVTVSVPRNGQFHRKAFALVKLSFDYWEPRNFITTVEMRTVKQLGKFLVRSGLDSETVRSLSSAFLAHLNASRETTEAEKSFDAFRDFVTVEAGYFNVVQTPAGPRKEPRSWSFASMDNDEFGVFYKAMFAVCWKLVLSQRFASEEEAEAVAEQLLNFD